VEFRDYLRLLRRRWVTILVVLVACVVGSGVVTVLTPPSYRSTTDVLVALPQGGVTGSGADGGLSAAYTTNLPAIVASFATVVNTPQTLDAAITAAGLPVGTSAGISGAAAKDTAVLTVTVVASTASTAQAVAAAFADTFPDVLVSLSQLSNRNALTFRTIRPAGLPASAFQPRPLVNSAIGLAVGLVLGLAVAIAREAVDRRIRDSRGIEERVGVTVLGVVPYELSGTDLPSASHPDSVRAESYRKIRTSLLFSGPDGMVRSLAVTSAVAGEGKTSLAANLAVVCARGGQRVALVDADLRRPTIHEKFGLTNEVGLSTVLAGEAELDDVVQVDRNGVTVLTAGPSPRDSSAMLESPRLRELVEELEKTFDVVIVDTTPALAVSDAAQVCSVCQGAVLVSRLRKTTYDSLARACTTLERVRTPALGIVAVGHDEDPDAGYQYYYAAADADARGRGSHRKGGTAESGRTGWRRQGSAS
jgi:succinoglycan biosynthesis transport protein ExoP